MSTTPPANKKSRSDKDRKQEAEEVTVEVVFEKEEIVEEIKGYSNNVDIDADDADDVDEDGREGTEDEKDGDYQNLITYANKSKDHTVEHVYYSLNNSGLRTTHWKKCVLASPSNVKVEACVEAEQRDCLSTVTLAWADKDWGTTQTEAQLKALREGQSAQVMGEEFIWEKRAEENDLEGTLLKELDKDEMQILYEVEGYRNEAMRRLQAVEYINSKIPNEDKVKIMASDPHYLLLVNKIQTLINDPRRKLVEKVALYHYYIRTDLCREEPMPLV